MGDSIFLRPRDFRSVWEEREKGEKKQGAVRGEKIYILKFLFGTMDDYYEVPDIWSSAVSEQTASTRPLEEIVQSIHQIDRGLRRSYSR